VELGRSVGWGDEVSVRYGVSADRARVLRTGL
jgi:hypothetical protein